MNTIETTLNDAFGRRQEGVIYNPLNQYRVVMELAPQSLQGPSAHPSLAKARSGGCWHEFRCNHHHQAIARSPRSGPG